MWKHQILAELQFLYAGALRSQSFPIWQERLPQMSSQLEESIGVFAGDILPIEKAGHLLVGKEMTRDFFHLPFSNTLFMYQEETKHAVHIGKLEGHGMLFSWGFIFDKDRNCWEPDAYCSLFNLNSETIHYYAALYSEAELEARLDSVLSKEDPQRHLSAVAFILNVLNCRNVQLAPLDPPERLNRARVKKGKRPLYRYHVLTVDLKRAQKATNSRDQAQFDMMPVHLCRGHFKEYTEDKPLFGRTTGRFWWQPYARGTAKNGVVIKDYDVRLS